MTYSALFQLKKILFVRTGVTFTKDVHSKGVLFGFLQSFPSSLSKLIYELNSVLFEGAARRLLASG